MTDTNKMRDEFEAWSGPRSDVERSKRGPFRGDYKNPVMQKMWEAWQASRQAVVVELPELSGITNAEDVDGSVIVPRIDQAYDQAIHECHEAIEAQGLRVGVRK